MKRIMLLVLLSLPLPLLASHYMGGEITWQCLPNGKYRFIMKLYRECSGIFFADPVTLNSTSPAGDITMFLFPGGNLKDGDDGHLDGKTDLSPTCWMIPPPITCNPGPGSPNTGAVQEYYYTSDQAYPDGVLLNGVPPLNGWIFSYSTCCRNPQTNILNPASISFFLRAVMFAYQGQDAHPCFDNAPVFAEAPQSVVCAGKPETFFNYVSDIESDSLVCEWAPALAGNINTPVTYALPFTFSNPMPGPSINPFNIAASLDAENGNISFTSHTTGAFTVVVRVTAYRAGTKIAEVFREFQLIVLACQSVNQPPEMSAPVYNPVTELFDLWTDTVALGTTIDYTVTMFDQDTLPNGNFHTITYYAWGENFGAGFSNNMAGCPNPPCATLLPAPPASSLIALAPQFQWQTQCSQAAYWFFANNYSWSDPYYYFPADFQFRVFDDFCPVPAYNSNTLKLVLRSPFVVEHPVLHCTYSDPQGNVVLQWNPPADPETTFYAYRIFRSNALNGTYQLIHTVHGIGQTTYTDPGINPGQASLYFYKIKSLSGCDGLFSRPGYSNVISTANVPHPELVCAITDQSGNVTLSWELPQDPAKSFYSHQIYRANSFTGNYQHIYSVYDTAQNTFVNYGVNPAAAYTYYYKIKTLSGCNGLNSPPGYSKVVSTIGIHVQMGQGDPVTLDWAVQGAIQTALPWFSIYANCSGAGWDLIAETPQYSYLTHNPGGIYDNCQFLVQFADSNGCHHSSVPGVYGSDGLSVQTPHCFTMFPNPASDALYIESSDNGALNGLELFDMFGKKTALNLSVNKEGNKGFIDVSFLRPGMYYVKNVHCREGRKLVITR
jgi:hypothetical protein